MMVMNVLKMNIQLEYPARNSDFSLKMSDKFPTQSLLDLYND